MMGPIVFVLLCLFHVGKSAVVEVIYSENEIQGTCTGTCGNMGTSTHKLGCSKLYDCKYNTKGWDVGFVRCDYCKCKCEKKDDDLDIKISQTWLRMNERAIFGTCTGTCHKGGLVRTNYQNCQEVRDCVRDRYGYNYWFVRCDHCKCKCINRVRASRYELYDLKYDMSGLKLVKGRPTALARTFAENHGNSAQSISRTLSFDRSETKSIETSASVEVGLSMTVTAGVTAGVASLEASVSTSITTGFSTTTGKDTSKTTSDSVTANCNVAARSKKEIIIKANKVKVDVPFTAKIKRIYKDGSYAIQSTKGVLGDMVVGDAHITYGKKQPL